MNKNTVYLSIAIAAIVILALVLLVPKKTTNTATNPAAQTGATDTATKTADTAQKISSSLNEIMASTVPTKCTYSMAIDSGEGGTTSGTVSASGGRVRSDIEVMMTGREKMTMHAIVKDGFEYVWYDNGPMAGSGMKLDINKLKSATKTQATEQQSVDMEKKLDMSCLPWITDGSQFDTPAGIEFKDISAGTTQIMQNAPKNACDACKMMPNAQTVEQCRQANKCTGE